MTIQAATPCLVLYGRATEAIAHYERALGARVETLIRFGDVPGMPCPDALRQKVVHSVLRIGNALLMVSDGGPDDADGTKTAGQSNCQVALEFDDAAELAAKFDALAAGGQVDMPPTQTFFSESFAAVFDKFGVRWMLNFAGKKG